MKKRDSTVEIVKNEIYEIASFLNAQSQPSLSTDLDRSARKIMLLAAASFFEHQITDLLKEYAIQASNDEKMANFLYNQAIKAKYHTLFSWGEQNNEFKPEKKARTFFKLFGREFTEECLAELDKMPAEQKAMADFLEIGHLRNILVHNNFGSYDLSSRTTSEIYDLYLSGIKFIDYLKFKLIKPQPQPQHPVSLNHF